MVLLYPISCHCHHRALESFVISRYTKIIFRVWVIFHLPYIMSTSLVFLSLYLYRQSPHLRKRFAPSYFCFGSLHIMQRQLCLISHNKRLDKEKNTIKSFQACCFALSLLIYDWISEVLCCKFPSIFLGRSTFFVFTPKYFTWQYTLSLKNLGPVRYVKYVYV